MVNLVFIQNYYEAIPFFLVSWSLCVEEHFYLVVPLLFVFWYGKKNVNVYLLAAVSLMLPAGFASSRISIFESGVWLCSHRHSPENGRVDFRVRTFLCCDQCAPAFQNYSENIALRLSFLGGPHDRSGFCHAVASIWFLGYGSGSLLFRGVSVCRLL